MKTILVDAMGTFVDEEAGMSEEMYALLQTYPNPKIVVSMAPDDLMEKWGLNNLPYECYTSRLDPKKTNPLFYEQLLQHYHLTAEEVVYFEHNQEAVAVAKTLGIVSYYYDSDKKDLESLKAFIDAHL